MQVFLSLFARITDVEKLYKITENYFSVDERAEATHRLGVLNLFDPLSPDRQFRLDLRRWDHRELTKLLIRLAQIEPGV